MEVSVAAEFVVSRVTTLDGYSAYFKELLSERLRRKSYEKRPESKDTKVLNMHNVFNLQKRHCERIACI
jgi:uncharacterized protein involved in cysteine biosynthesis